MGELSPAVARSWKQKLGKVTLLVPGQLLTTPFQNHIKLNSESRELSWHTASNTWIPEKGVYDHLVLKLAKD
jgi:hypothetical protein